VILVETLLDRFLLFHVGAQLRTRAFLRTILSVRSLDSAPLDGAEVGGNTAAARRERRPGDPQGGAAQAGRPPRGS
jgi:hypothetical protein